ncbi:hypothetical protein ACFHYE_10750 [Pasteurella multocida]
MKRFIKLTGLRIEIKENGLDYKSRLRDPVEEVKEYEKKLQVLLLRKESYKIQEVPIILDVEQITLVYPNVMFNGYKVKDLCKNINFGTQIHTKPDSAPRDYLLVSESVDEIYKLISEV